MIYSIYKKKTKQTLFTNLNKWKKEVNMFLSINQNIGNIVNNAFLYFKNKLSTEQSTQELGATTEEQKTNNSDIQRDLKEEFLRVVQYSDASYAEFIEKFLNNPKFSNVLTKTVDHQDLSEIETILLNSIMEHLELLRSFELFGNHFHTFLADPLDEKQECEEEYGEFKIYCNARYQKFKNQIADSLATIEQQLEFSVYDEERVIASLEEIRLIEAILDNINDLTFEQKDYVAHRVEAIVNERENISNRAETDDCFLQHFKHQVLRALEAPLIRIALTEYIAAYEIKFAENNTKNIKYRLAFANSKLTEKFEHFKKVHHAMLEEHSVQIAEVTNFFKEYHYVIAEEECYDTQLDDLFYFANLSFSDYVECGCGFCCNCVSSEASTRFEEEQKATKKDIKIKMKQHKKAKQHLSKVEKQFEALIKQLSEPNLEEENMKKASL